MKFLFLLNGSPYGDDRTYNAIRLANALAKRERNEVRVFLMGDAVGSAKCGQKVAEGFYNLQHMLERLTTKSPCIGICGSCMDARGLQVDELIQGAHRGSLEELADWSEWADKVFVF